ncbi:MAG: relaxase/mobilization nuclease domain-containing protein [Coleofasciculus sp. S288]|nr:relaxase/mobilization nuclease domain-containing protein [Coleofasciculus sp. S288]
MIAKITKGNGFSGLCSYVLGKAEARLIGGNMASTTPRQLAAEFRAFSRQNLRVQRPVEHISLSPSPEDRELDDQEWEAIAIDLLDGLGMSQNQYILVLHSDTEVQGKPRPHLHIVVNRVSIDGQCADSWWDFRRTEEILRQLEQNYELTPVASSWESEKSADTTGQTRLLRKEAEQGLEPQESIKRRLQKLCDQAASDNPVMSTFLQRLKDAGVEPRIRQTRTGKVQGISYELEGVAFAGHKLGRNYSYQGLQKLGITEHLEPQQLPAPTAKHSVKRKSKQRSCGLEL